MGAVQSKMVRYLFWFVGVCYIADLGIVIFGCWP